MAGFRIEGFTQTTELQGGNKVVQVREYRVVELPHEVYFQFRRPKAKWAPATIKSVAQQFADRIEGVLNLANVVDVAYSQDVTPSGQLQDMMTTYYATADDEISGSVEQRLANFGPTVTGRLVNAEIAAGGDFLGG